MEKTLSHDHNKNKCGMAFHKNKFAQKRKEQTQYSSSSSSYYCYSNTNIKDAL